MAPPSAFSCSTRNSNFPDAILDLAQRAGLEVPREAQTTAERTGGPDLYDILARASRFFEQNLRDYVRGAAYLRKRGIDAPTTARFALGLAPDYKDQR